MNKYVKALMDRWLHIVTPKLYYSSFWAWVVAAVVFQRSLAFYGESMTQFLLAGNFGAALFMLALILFFGVPFALVDFILLAKVVERVFGIPTERKVAEALFGE